MCIRSVYPYIPGRQWTYDDRVSEYYVILDDKGTHKKSDTTKDIEETDLGETWPYACRSFL